MSSPLPLLERLVEAIELDNSGCWLWALSIDTCGYGKFRIKGKNKKAHRVAYELIVGAIPDGLQIDHLCRVRRCVNPEHMECVTSRVNTMRGDTLGKLNASKTHCPQGHPYNEENTVVSWTGKNWARRCRMCRNAYGRRYKARKRSELKTAQKGLRS